MPGSPTAAQTALFLRKLATHGPLSEPALRLLNDYCQAWTQVHLELTPAYEDFLMAYLRWQPWNPKRSTPEDWERLADAAKPLASALNKYKEELLPEEKT